MRKLCPPAEYIAKGFRHLGRREDLDPGVPAPPPERFAGPGPGDAGRARVRPRRGARLSRRVGRASRQGVRALRAKDRQPFDRLVNQVMTQKPYASARRVFWVTSSLLAELETPSSLRRPASSGYQPAAEPNGRDHGLRAAWVKYTEHTFGRALASDLSSGKRKRHSYLLRMTSSSTRTRRCARAA